MHAPMLDGQGLCPGRGMSPSLQHGMPFCIPYCRKEAKASTRKYADGHKKKPPRHSSRGGTFTACSWGLPRSQLFVSRRGDALAQIHVGLKVKFVLARPVTQAGMVAELLKRNILRHGIGAFETYLDLTHAIV